MICEILEHVVYYREIAENDEKFYYQVFRFFLVLDWQCLVFYKRKKNYSSENKKQNKQNYKLINQ